MQRWKLFCNDPFDEEIMVREIECAYLSVNGNAVQIWNGTPFELTEVFVMNFGERLVRVFD